MDKVESHLERNIAQWFSLPSLLSNFCSVPDRKEKKKTKQNLYENPDNLACDSKEYLVLKIQTCLV